MRTVGRTIFWTSVLAILGSVHDGRWPVLNDGALGTLMAILGAALSGVQLVISWTLRLHEASPTIFWTLLGLAGFGWMAANAHKLTFGADKDPKRLFTVEERNLAAARAGGRCEHKPVLLPRCHGAAEQGDHVFPHSKGGATSIENLSMLCGRCNRRKSNRVPSRLYMIRLARRRKKYFPPGVPTEVNWVRRG